MEALGGSAHSRDKLTERESLLHSQPSFLLACNLSLSLSLSRTHTYAGVHIDTQKRPIFMESK